MAVETAPLLLSSREEVESILSRVGVDLRIDDDLDGVTDGSAGGPNDEQLLIDALIEASDEAYEKLLHKYDAVVLETSHWVRRRTSYIVAHLLSVRKGNPGMFCEQYEKYLEDFERVGLTNRSFIPRLAPRINSAPTMSNPAVSLWHGYQNIRTMVDNSEGPRDGKQFEDTVFHGYKGWWWIVLIAASYPALPWLG